MPLQCEMLIGPNFLLLPILECAAFYVYVFPFALADSDVTVKHSIVLSRHQS